MHKNTHVYRKSYTQKFSNRHLKKNERYLDFRIANVVYHARTRGRFLANFNYIKIYNVIFCILFTSEAMITGLSVSVLCN